MRWHCPPDTGFEIRALAVWGRARYLSVTEAPRNTDFHTWMGKKHFCFFQTAETGNRTPNSGVKGSGANHYPRAPALVVDRHLSLPTTGCFMVLNSYTGNAWTYKLLGRLTWFIVKKGIQWFPRHSGRDTAVCQGRRNLICDSHKLCVMISGHAVHYVPVHWRCWTNADIMLDQRLRRWPNIISALVQLVCWWCDWVIMNSRNKWRHSMSAPVIYITYSKQVMGTLSQMHRKTRICMGCTRGHEWIMKSAFHSLMSPVEDKDSHRRVRCLPHVSQKKCHMKSIINLISQLHYVLVWSRYPRWQKDWLLVLLHLLPPQFNLGDM